MGLHAEWLRYGDDHVGYVCWPERARVPLPSIVVVQEAWGVDAHIEDLTRRFAAAGYVAMAPDLLARSGERPPSVTRERVAEVRAWVNSFPPPGIFDPQRRAVELAALPEAERQRLDETFEAVLGTLLAGRLDLTTFLPQLLATSRLLAGELGASKGQRVGAIGFCLGGALSSLLAAADPALAAAVIFYGSAPPAARVADIRCPVLGHYAGDDPRINAGIPAFEAAMRQHGGSLETHSYPGARHAFFNDNGPTYDAPAARQAFSRTLEFFVRHLAQ